MPTSLFDVPGRVALITGGSKGLGFAMARALARVGANVVISSRHGNELEAARIRIADDGAGRVEAIVADMAKREDVNRLTREALERMGRVDILINNAGTNVPQSIDQIDDGDWDRVLEINLTACMALTRALAPPMKERQWGRIIHISSIMALGSKAARNVYSATKAALIGMARASALDLGPFGITVNCIAPGPFLTDLPGTLLSAEEKQTFADRTALGRWGDPDELAGTALLLASDAGSYITGATLVVDGGVLCKTL